MDLIIASTPYSGASGLIERLEEHLSVKASYVPHPLFTWSRKFSRLNEALLKVNPDKGSEKLIKTMLEEWAGDGIAMFDSLGVEANSLPYEWLHNLFPEAKMIFLLGSHAKSLASIMARKDDYRTLYGCCMGKMETSLGRQILTMRRYMEKNPEKCVAVEFDDYDKLEIPTLLERVGTSCS